MPVDTSKPIVLVHGAKMPRIGFGTGGRRISNDDAPRVVGQAIDVGYRMIDTAERYGNEEGVGRAIRDSGIDRSSIFLTSKLNVGWHGQELVRQAFEASAKRLRTDYIDLYMIHWPNPWLDRYVEAWEGMIHLLQDKKVRAIGMSNFTPVHLERITKATGVRPDVNQIQLNPYVGRAGERRYHAEHGIITQSWAPLSKGGPLLSEPVILDIAARHGRSPAQVVMRWHVELDVVPQPGSLSKEHMADNLAALEFSLRPQEVGTISGLNGGPEEVTDPEIFGH